MYLIARDSIISSLHHSKFTAISFEENLMITFFKYPGKDTVSINHLAFPLKQTLFLHFCKILMKVRDRFNSNKVVEQSVTFIR